jgi:hypothetical protein
MHDKFCPVDDYEFVTAGLKRDACTDRDATAQGMEGGATQRLMQYLVFKATSIQEKNRLCAIFKSDSHREQTSCFSPVHRSASNVPDVIHRH